MGNPGITVQNSGGWDFKSQRWKFRKILVVSPERTVNQCELPWWKVVGQLQNV